MQRLFQALERMQSCKSFTEMEPALLSELEGFEICSFLITINHYSIAPHRRYFSSSSWPSGLLSEYRARNFHGCDPLRSKAKIAVTSFTSAEAWEGIEPTSEQRSLAEMLKRYQMDRVVCVPLQVFESPNIAIFKTSRTDFTDEERQFLLVISSLAANLLSRMRDVREETPNPVSYEFSPRAAEVLRWAAQGRSSKDIAQILEISESAVNKHFTTAQNILGTKNRIETIVQAINRGLLYQ